MFSSFFLGANSGHGFHSFYDELIDLHNANSVYILKGGPGSGKSSLMRSLVRKANNLNIPYEQIFCSSDPDSLDGVVFPTLGTAVCDGTAPHIVEPKFPLAVERYINLGRFADIAKIQEKKDDIIKVKEQYSTFFDRAYRMTACAEKIDDELFDKALGTVTIEYLKKKARGIISREITGKGSGKAFKRRFCEAISPKGYMSLLYDKEFNISRTFIIEDSYGLAHFLLNTIKDAAYTANYACIGCYNPLKPSQMVHLYIPELSLCFVTSSRDIPISGMHYRKMRLDALVEASLSPLERTKLKRLRALRKNFIDEACSILAEAKLVHDDLENLYNPHIDFDALYSFSSNLADEIFA